MRIKHILRSNARKTLVPLSHYSNSARFFSSGMNFYSTALSNSIPTLQALNKFTDFVSTRKDLLIPENTFILFVTHAFPTILPVLQSLTRLGAKKEKIMVMGKFYSETEETVQLLKQEDFYYQMSSPPTTLGGHKQSFTMDAVSLLLKCADRIKPHDRLMVFDHGGDILSLIPHHILKNHDVVGIEKTTAGLKHSEFQGTPFPVIRMADSAAKTELESDIIAFEISEKISRFIPINETSLTCGVVGFGSIGKAITKKLVSLGHKVVIYDVDFERLKSDEGIIPVKNMSSLISSSSIIFECTGNDISKETELFEMANSSKTLISCSSGDTAYNSLLKLVQRKNKTLLDERASTIQYTNKLGNLISIFRNGYPANFDNISEASKPDEISLTRTLAIASGIHAAQLFKQPQLLKKYGSYMLDPHLQQLVTRSWLTPELMARYSKEQLEVFMDIEKIKGKSGGEFARIPSLEDIDLTSLPAQEAQRGTLNARM